MPSRPLSEAEFWARGKRVGECLEWQRYRQKSGYGRLRWKGKDDRAHRVAWMLTQGPIPTGLEICHTCDNPPCFEPTHLFLGTFTDNAMDARRKGRLSVGERHYASRLSDAIVREIRLLSGQGMSQRVIGRRFGIRQSTVSKIVLRQSWAHVD